MIRGIGDVPAFNCSLSRLLSLGRLCGGPRREIEVIRAKKLLRSLLVFAPRLQDTRFRAEARFIRAFRRPFRPEFAGLRALALQDPLVLDIGCNRGISIETILAMRPDARVIGFEANAFLAADTKRWFAAEPRVEIRPVGLGNRASSIDIHVPRFRNYRFDGWDRSTVR